MFVTWLWPARVVYDCLQDIIAVLVVIPEIIKTNLVFPSQVKRVLHSDSWIISGHIRALRTIQGLPCGVSGCDGNLNGLGWCDVLLIGDVLGRTILFMYFDWTTILGDAIVVHKGEWVLICLALAPYFSDSSSCIGERPSRWTGFRRLCDNLWIVSVEFWIWLGQE